MKKSAYILIALTICYLVFYAWHTPLRGPLTDSEIDTFLANQTTAVGTEWANSENFEAFLRDDDGLPFIMINLMEVREDAIYPNGFISDIHSGDKADAAYGQAVLPLLLMRGSYPIASAVRSNTIINSLGEKAGSFDTVAMVRYRSRRDLISMISSVDFLKAEVHKWASLENTLVAPAESGPSLNFLANIPVYILLCFMGVAGYSVSRKFS